MTLTTNFLVLSHFWNLLVDGPYPHSVSSDFCCAPLVIPKGFKEGFSVNFAISDMHLEVQLHIFGLTRMLHALFNIGADFLFVMLSFYSMSSLSLYFFCNHPCYVLFVWKLLGLFSFFLWTISPD